MAVNRLPSGRWRVQLYVGGRLVSIAKIMGPPATFETERLARRAESDAYRFLEQDKALGVTVQDWADRWLTDPLYRRPKESTMIHNRERVKRFVERYGALELGRVDDRIVAEWIAGGKNLSTIPVLKAMFNDAGSAKAGRLVTANPFAGLKLGVGKGRALDDPPSEAIVQALIRSAREVTCPSFAAWLQTAAYTGMRPGELDGLRWASVDLEGSRIRVVEQFSAKSRSFTLPKNGLKREAIITPPARDALMGLPRAGEFCFTGLTGKHWTASARAYHWKSVRAAVGYRDTLYLATRHFAGWYMTNVLGLSAEDVAVALGHTDGGYLVRTRYGHLDRSQALDRVSEAYERIGNVVPLRSVKEGA